MVSKLKVSLAEKGPSSKSVNQAEGYFARAINVIVALVSVFSIWNARIFRKKSFLMAETSQREDST